MEVLDTYVKLLGKMDYREDAWKTSRPETKEADFDMINRIDTSLTSMCLYTIEMRSSLWFRDLIFSLRPLGAWAASSRSIPLSRETLRLSSEHAIDGMGQDGIDEFFKLVAEGKSRDAARDVLPLSASTTYTFTIDHRVLISFCRTMEEINPQLFTGYCIPMLQVAGIDSTLYSDSLVKSSVEYYRISEEEMINGSVTTGNMIHGHYKVKLALASQLLRQHYSKIKIGLWNITPDYFEIDLRQSDLMDVVYYVDIHSYHRLMQMRSNWLVDHSLDMWGKIVGDYINGMDAVDFWKFIPAGSGIDPGFADNLNRIDLTDVGLPCPIMTECRSILDDRRKEIGDNPITDMYEQLFERGIVKDNPDNLHRIKYFFNLENKDE